MSYILDALRKADAQRERDPARGIHAQPARPAMGEQAPPVRERPWFWAAGAAGVAAVAVGGWYLYRDSPAAPQVAQVAVAPQDAAAPAAPLEPAPAPPPAAVVLPPPVIVAPPVAPAPLPAPTRTERSVGGTPPMDGVSPRAARSAMAPSRAIVPAQATVLVPPAGSVASSVMPGASGPVMAAPAQMGTPPQAGSGMPQPHIPTPPPSQPPGMAPLPAPPPRAAPAPIPPAPPTPPVAGLPADAPKLVITGGVYSANKAQRMLIVNGQVVGEGADLGSGVVDRGDQAQDRGAALPRRPLHGRVLSPRASEPIAPAPAAAGTRTSGRP